MLASAVVAAALGSGPAPEPVHALLITGQNNHNWEYTSRLHKETLEATGRFVVDITDEPAKTLADAGALTPYTLFVLDYNGQRWGDAAEKNFAQAVSGGTGVVFIHASNNAFRGWKEYEEICGLLWEQNVTGHGKFHPFDIAWTDAASPITGGLPPMKGHPDELYHRLVNPQRVEFTVLATAYSDKASGGVDEAQPMALTLTHGKGRIFHTPLGHVWKNAPETKVSVADPAFKTLLCRGAEWAATDAVTLPAAWADVRPHNTLTEAERKDGWTLLFDGADAAHVRAYRGKGLPEKGWTVEEGTLRHTKGAGGGDIVVGDDLADFEIACDFRVAPGANSGIIYRVSEDHGASYESGPEMQILDDAAHKDGLDPKTSSGAFYALYAPAHDVARPAGEWNHARVVVRGPHAEHWLNGYKIVDADMGSPEFKALVEKSKFKDMPGFAKNTHGFVVLQDHGDDVWFRDIKVRAIPK